MHKKSLRLTLKEGPKGAIKKSPSNHPEHKALSNHLSNMLKNTKQPHINDLATIPWDSFNTMQKCCLIIVKRKRHKTRRKEKSERKKTETENKASVQAGHAGLTRLARAIVGNGVLIVIQGININFQVNSIGTISLH